MLSGGVTLKVNLGEGCLRPRASRVSEFDERHHPQPFRSSPAIAETCLAVKKVLSHIDGFGAVHIDHQIGQRLFIFIIGHRHTHCGNYGPQLVSKQLRITT